MIHQYKLNGYNIVLDVYSGSVHCVDDVAYDIIQLFCTEKKDEIIRQMLEKYGDRPDVTPEDLEDVFQDIEELKRQKKLFAEDIYEPKAFDLKNRHTEIKALCLHVAHTCNLNCEYCFARQGRFNGERGVMSLETGKRALDFLIENSGDRRNLEVDFFGGEPLMNWEVVKGIVEYGRSIEKEHGKNFRFTLTTNGVGINDDVIEFANKEMHNVVLSLDGRKEVHDRLRRTINDEGSYDIIVPKFKKLVEARGGKNYYMRGTFTHNNVDFTNDIFHMKESNNRYVTLWAERLPARGECINMSDNRYEFPAEVRTFLEAMPLAIAAYQFVGGKVVTLLVSDGMCEFEGMNRKNLTESFDSSMFDLVHPDDVKRLAEIGYRYATEGGPYDVIYRSRLPESAHYRTVHCVSKYMTMNDGSRVAFSFYTDISEPVKQGEVDYAEQTEPLARYIEEDADPMVVIERDTNKILYYNKAIVSMLKPPVTYDSGMTFTDYFYPGTRDPLMININEVDMGLQQVKEIRTGRELGINVMSAMWGEKPAYIAHFYEMQDIIGKNAGEASKRARRLAFHVCSVYQFSTVVSILS